MSILSRGPNGRFLKYGDEIAAWLPVLLRHRGGIGTITLMEALELCVVFCAESAGRFAAGNAVILSYNKPNDFDWRIKYTTENLERWQKRRAILLKAIEDIRAVDR